MLRKKLVTACIWFVNSGTLLTVSVFCSSDCSAKDISSNVFLYSSHSLGLSHSSISSFLSSNGYTFPHSGWLFKRFTTSTTAP